jgi:hypothetical protein
LLFFHQFVDNLSIEPHEIFRKSFAKPLKPAMPTPEVPHSIPPIAARLAFHFCRDVALSLPQKPGPDSLSPKNIYKLNPLTFSDPEPAVDNEPQRSESLGRSLHLGDDFLRHRPRSLLIARKVHRVLGAALRR